MKYITKTIIAVFLLVVAISCGSDSDSSVYKRNKVIYKELYTYGGSEDGATKAFFDTIRIDTIYKITETKEVITGEDGKNTTIVKKDTVLVRIDTIAFDVDSLCKVLVRNRYFAKDDGSATVTDAVRSLYEDIDFEFVGDNGELLSYKGPNLKGNLSRIIASYKYSGDSLYVLEGNTDPVFVARKSKDKDEFFRTVTLFYYNVILPGGKNQTKDTKIFKDKALVEMGEPTLNNVLDAIGISDPKLLIESNDSIVWCNVRYIFE